MKSIVVSRFGISLLGATVAIAGAADYDPNSAYDPGTDGWTLGDPFAGGSSSDTGS